MKGSYGTPMQAYSRFNSKEDYWRWVHLKNRPVKKKQAEASKHYRYKKNGEWVDVYIEKEI